MNKKIVGKTRVRRTEDEEEPANKRQQIASSDGSTVSTTGSSSAVNFSGISGLEQAVNHSFSVGPGGAIADTISATNASVPVEAHSSSVSGSIESSNDIGQIPIDTIPIGQNSSMQSTMTGVHHFPTGLSMAGILNEGYTHDIGSFQRISETQTIPLPPKRFGNYSPFHS